MELSFIRGLYDVPGPWASVYLDATHHTEPSRATIKIRWKDLRRALRDQGLDEPTLHALQAELVDEQTMRALDSVEPEGRKHRGWHGLALFAAQGEVRHAELLSEPPQRDVADVSPLPHLTPLLSERGEQVPTVRVIVNRVGADIDDPSGGVIQVEGHHLVPIRKTHGGGWSEEHLHRKAELRWHDNTREVADQVDRFADSVGAELVIVAGDVRARQLLIDQLPQRWRARLVEVDGGSRAPGADLTAIDRVAEQAVAEVAARRQAAAVDRFLAQFQVPGRGSAVAGVQAVAAAFEQAQVDTLLLDPDDVSQARAAPWPQAGRADDALIRSAALTDAELVLVSPSNGWLDGGRRRLDDGVGAVLRYSTRG
jgi:Bacterial archaeo-eukaryotic release factor family 2